MTTKWRRAISATRCVWRGSRPTTCSRRRGSPWRRQQIRSRLPFPDSARHNDAILDERPTMTRKRVLLLNPPGRDLYIRDYFCSKTTKSNYLFHPIDLLVLSGAFAERHETAVLDAVAERLPAAEAAARI